ncbi:MAG TPA: helix-turn-helix transcriptional regulator [Candidatus Baltobacteraceae bacterium]|jgi:DNA-binding CsgD family transcriptional regulator
MQSWQGRQNVSDSLLELIKKRAKPRLILLDESYGIAFAEPDATSVIAGLMNFPQQRISRLPLPIEAAVRSIVQSWKSGEAVEQVVTPLPDVVLRVGRLDGQGGCYIAVYIEHHKSREDLAQTAHRYSLTRRERQVLTLILGGASGADIAEELNISESTVSDYFKHLLTKTGAKNRADMLAKVLGWDSDVHAPAPRERAARKTESC